MDLDQVTGGEIDGWAHVVQSISTILTTALNTRVFRREFGSELPNLVDDPMNDAGVLSVYVAVAQAIDRWEPRFDLSEVQIDTAASGTLRLALQGSYRPNAHLGDFSIAQDDARSVRVDLNGVDSWGIAA